MNNHASTNFKEQMARVTTAYGARMLVRVAERRVQDAWDMGPVANVLRESWQADLDRARAYFTDKGLL